MIRHQRVLHINLINNEPIDYRTIKCPYGSILNDLICMVGCGFRASSKSELRVHLIIYHCHEQLKMWGVNRDFLKLQEGIID